MQTHIAPAHPEAASFNAQLARISADMLGNATVSDLYAMGFDPCQGPRHYARRKDPGRFHVQTEQRHGADTGTLPADIEAEMARILACDLLVVHFPLWWFGPPAILKGWMDRFFVYGRMYRSAIRYDAGLCAGKRMIACITTGASAESCAHNGREGDTMLHLWPVLFPFRYLGFEVYRSEVLHGVGGVAFLEEAADGLSTLDICKARWAEALAALPDRALVPYNRDSDFNETKRLRPGAPVHSPFVRHDPDAT